MVIVHYNPKGVVCEGTPLDPVRHRLRSIAVKRIEPAKKEKLWQKLQKASGMDKNREFHIYILYFFLSSFFPIFFTDFDSIGIQSLA